MNEIARGVVAGVEASLARALSVLEHGGQQATDLRQALRAHLGHASVVGMTGPPGAGKSSLIGAMISVLREQHQRVAVLAVDPTSPITGGAVLGDRTRMGEHSVDPGVFIRSVASRGGTGGLSRAIPALVDALDAARWDVILLETVGSGQSDVDVADFADVAVLVSVPGLGDEVQAIKAGMLELADVLVVNKADLPGSDRIARQLRQMLALRAPGAIRPPVIRTSVPEGTGLVELVDAVRTAEPRDGGARRLRREIVREAEAEFARRLDDKLVDDACDAVSAGADIGDVARQLSRS